MESETYISTIRRHYAEYDQTSKAGDCIPFVLPLHILNYVILVCCISFSTGWPVLARWFTFIIVILQSALTMRESRSVGLAHGVVVGIASAWAVLITLNLLLLHDPRRDFQRMIPSKSKLAASAASDEKQRASLSAKLRWQSMPDKFPANVFWTMDLLGSMRLLHWSIGRPHQKIEATGFYFDEEKMRYLSLSRCLLRLLIVYLTIDVLKEIVAIDPYFWGQIGANPPPSITEFIPCRYLIRFYRLSTAFSLIYLAIALVDTAGHILFLHILKHNIAGVWGEKWTYRPQFGTLATIYTNGLRGFWGSGWHQMFRHMLTSTADEAVKIFRLESQSQTASAVKVSFSFLISGIIHACGSYTLWGNTQPLYACLFFLLQPFGILIQYLYTQMITKSIKDDTTRYHIQGVANVGFVAAFLFLTFPLLADDFARGGLWLSEPFPVSVVQTLGFGNAQRAHSLWLGSEFGWYSGRYWWKSGIAL